MLKILAQCTICLFWQIFYDNFASYVCAILYKFLTLSSCLDVCYYFLRNGCLVVCLPGRNFGQRGRWSIHQVKVEGSGWVLRICRGFGIHQVEVEDGRLVL